MSYLINAALAHAANACRNQTFRLLQGPTSSIFHPLKQVFARRPLPSISISGATGAPSRFNCTRAYDLNTNVTKDVILFKYENPKFYKMLNFFAFGQFIFWTYLSHFAFTTLKDAPVDQSPDADLAWYQRINLGENKYRNGITIACFMMGYGILAAVWLYTLRSVRFLILRKGGKDLSFVTYGPFNKNRIMTVPLKYVSAEESREAAKVQLPIKVKNRNLFYVLDMRGEFKNPQLFDYTAGLRRKI